MIAMQFFLSFPVQFDETRETLLYANRAKSIKVRRMTACK